MVRVMYSLLGIAVGGVMTLVIANSVLDPEAQWESSKILAANAAILGCARGGDMPYEDCRKIGADVYKELSNINFVHVTK